MCIAQQASSVHPWTPVLVCVCPQKPAPKAQGGQSKTAGLLPPNSSDEEEDSEEESESDDDQPVNEYLSGPRQPKK